MPAAILGSGFLLLGACGGGTEVILSEAGGQSVGEGETVEQTEPTTPPDGDQPTPEQPAADQKQPDLGRPDEVMAEIRDGLDDEQVSGEEALDAIEPLDEEPTAADISDADKIRDDGVTPGDGPRNEAGEPIELDEAAALACADVERALTAVDEGATDTARDEVASAAGRAGESSVADIVEWSEPLAAWTGVDDDPAVLLGFLSICTEGGYEL